MCCGSGEEGLWGWGRVAGRVPHLLGGTSQQGRLGISEISCDLELPRLISCVCTWNTGGTVGLPNPTPLAHLTFCSKSLCVRAAYSLGKFLSRFKRRLKALLIKLKSNPLRAALSD